VAEMIVAETGQQVEHLAVAEDLGDGRPPP